MEMNPQRNNDFQPNPGNPSFAPAPPCLSGAADASHHKPPTQANPKERSQESNEVPVVRRKRGRPPKKAKPINPTESCMPPPPPPQIPPNQSLQQKRPRPQMHQNLMVPWAMQQTQQPQLRPTCQAQQSHTRPTMEAQKPHPRPMEQAQHPWPRSTTLCHISFLMEFMHFRWAKPEDNSIEYWTEYVAKYYDPRAKEKWCLFTCTKGDETSEDNDRGHCDICGWKSNQAIYVGFEDLPRKLKAKFEEVDGERLNLGMAVEDGSVPGVTILLFPEATQRRICGPEITVYEGLLRVKITDKWKILAWEFCVGRVEAFFSVPLPRSRDDRWLGIGEIFGRRSGTNNVPAESPQEVPQTNNGMWLNSGRHNNGGLQNSNPPCPGSGLQGQEMLVAGGQADDQGQQIKPMNVKRKRGRPRTKFGLQRQERLTPQRQTNFPGQQRKNLTMNSTLGQPCPPSGLQGQEMLFQADTSGQQINHATMNCTTGINSVSIGVEDIQTAALPVHSGETCLIRNPAANLPTPPQEEQLISNSTGNNQEATHTSQTSNMIAVGENANGIPENEVLGEVSITQTIAANQIPSTAMEPQVQGMTVMEYPASAQPLLTNEDTVKCPVVKPDCHIVIDQQNGIEMEISGDFISTGVDITEETALGDEEIKAYLMFDAAAEFYTQEMQVMNQQASGQGQLTCHNTMNHETMYSDPGNNLNMIDMQNEDWTLDDCMTAELSSLPNDGTPELLESSPLLEIARVLSQ